MTKTVRIENADTSKYKVKILIQELVYDHNLQQMGTEWITSRVVNLDTPCSMYADYLTTTKRFIIEENGTYSE